MQQSSASSPFNFGEPCGSERLLSDDHPSVAVGRRQHVVGDGRQSAARRVEARTTRQQALRVRVLRVREDVPHAVVFDQLASIHDGHFVGDLGDHTEVVRDEQNRHATLIAQLADQREDLSLDRHVECGGWLVGDEQLRIARQRHRDHDALLLTARHLVRVLVERHLGLRNADLLEEFERAGTSLGASHLLVQQDRFGHLIADAIDRVERGPRLLKDHGDVFAAHMPHLGARQLNQIAAEERDAPRRDARPDVGQQSHDRQRRDRLARPGLTHETQRLAEPDLHRQAIHRLDGPAVRMEVRLEIIDFEQGCVTSSMVAESCVRHRNFHHKRLTP